MLTPDVVAVSYGLGALAFGAFTLLMLTAWRGRLQGALLVAASGVSTLWCLAHVGHALATLPPFWALQLCEAARDGAWFAFLLGLLTAGGEGRRRSLRTAMTACAVLLAALAAASVMGGFGWTVGLGVAGLTRLTLTLHLAAGVAGLVLVHQLFRDTRDEHRWAVKFLIFGLGGLFAFDVYVYSLGLLFNRLDGASWAARGVVNAIVVPFLAVAAQRNPTWSVELFVSRHVVFHSTALVAVGIYLMAMAAAGYYIRVYGGALGGVVQVAFLFLALIMLAALMLSGQARARLRVFLNKHFFKNKYDYRQEWLKFTQALDGEVPDSRPEDNIVKAFADIVEARGGVLWVRQSSDHYQPAAAVGTALPGAAALRPDAALARFLERSGWVVYLDEFQREPGRYSGLVLPDWIVGLREPWIIIPLMQGPDLVGFVVLTRPPTPRYLNWEDTDLLKTCGRQAASHLALLKVSQALADARQFEAFNRLSAYVVHDLKNLVAQLSLVVSNARRHMHSPGFVEDAIDTVDNASQKMTRLLAHLRKGREGEGQARALNLLSVAEAVVRDRAATAPAPTLDADGHSLTVVADPDRLASVLEHLVQNAQEATPDDGSVTVRLRHDGSVAQLDVVDTGCGMDPRFISERLFRPFDTTKGNAGMGVGVYETREFVQAAGGTLDVESTPGRGTTFRVRLPLEAPVPAVAGEPGGAVEVHR